MSTRMERRLVVVLGLGDGGEGVVEGVLTAGVLLLTAALGVVAGELQSRSHRMSTYCVMNRWSRDLRALMIAF